MAHITSGLERWPTYRTSRDLAAAIGQHERTARRILREVFGDEEGAKHWKLGPGEWEKVLLHLATSDSRRYGRRRIRREVARA